MVVPVVLTTVTTIATFMISTTNNLVSITLPSTKRVHVHRPDGGVIIWLLLIPAWTLHLGRGSDDANKSLDAVHKESIISRYLVAFCCWLDPLSQTRF